MITSRTVLETAAETGFRSEVVEKVLRLRGILNRLDGHPSSRREVSPPLCERARGLAEPRGRRQLRRTCSAARCGAAPDTLSPWLRARGPYAHARGASRRKVHRAAPAIRRARCLRRGESTIHPVGRHKQRFFVAVGFSYDRPEDLVAAIRRVAREGMLRDETATRYGTKYIMDGWLVAPIGRVGIRTVWIVPEGSLVPELVTGFPHSLEREDP